MDQSDVYKFVDNVTPLSAKELNGRFLDINARLGMVEANKPTLDAAVNDLVSIGLSRINAALLPAFNELLNIQKLGFLSAPIAADSNVVFGVNASTGIAIDPSYAQYFVPPPWVAIVRAANATDYCIAKVLSYVSATGALQLDITTQSGNAGTYTDVTVIGCPGGALAAIDAYAHIAANLITINAALSTIEADLITIESDRVIVEGIINSGPVTSINGLTGAVTGIEQTAHKGAANGYAGLDTNALIPMSQLPAGSASGLARLDSNALMPISVLPASVQNCDKYLGTWSALYNNPTLVSNVGQLGSYYIVSAAGTTELNGVTSWGVGDAAYFNGTAWVRRSGARVVGTTAGTLAAGDDIRISRAKRLVFAF